MSQQAKPRIQPATPWELAHIDELINANASRAIPTLLAQIETLRGALKECIGAMNSADQILALHDVLPSNATRQWAIDARNIGEAALAATAKVTS